MYFSSSLLRLLLRLICAPQYSYSLRLTLYTQIQMCSLISPFSLAHCSRICHSLPITRLSSQVGTLSVVDDELAVSKSTGQSWYSSSVYFWDRTLQIVTKCDGGLRRYFGSGSLSSLQTVCASHKFSNSRGVSVDLCLPRRDRSYLLSSFLSISSQTFLLPLGCLPRKHIISHVSHTLHVNAVGLNVGDLRIYSRFRWVGTKIE